MSTRIFYGTDGSLYYPWNTSNGYLYAENSGNKVVNDSEPYANTSNNDAAGVIHFPVPVAIDKIIFRAAEWCDSTCKFEVSTTDNNPSTNGIDGTWTVIWNVGSQAPLAVYSNSFTPTLHAQWLRFSGIGRMKALLLFGHYETQRVQYYNAAGDTELDEADYPLSFANVGNAATFDEYREFRIKNVSGDTRSYNITASAYNAGVGSNLTLSKDSGVTKTGTIAIAGLANNTLSDIIRCYLYLTPANNPANGGHIIRITTTETA